MREAVEGDLGRQFTTGAKVPGVPTAGKSGTAELGGKGEPHSWFIGFAPADAPTVAIAVLVEQGGRGAEAAAPIAGDMMTRYLRGDPVTDDPSRDPRHTRARRDARRPTPQPTPEREGRPLIERIGLAAIALGIGVMFGGVGYAAWLGGELFLAVIGGISCVMTLWVGGLTLHPRLITSPPSAARQTRRTSATPQAWNGQPRGSNGGSGSRISETDPRPASARWPSNGRRMARPASDRPVTRAVASAYGPDEPGPDRALVVAGVAEPAVALVVRPVGRVGRGEGAQARAAPPARRGTAATTRRAARRRRAGGGGRPRGAGSGRSAGSSPSGPSTTSSR